MPIYLGIDGGGTKTTCAVGDESRVLATGEAGGCNVVRSGEAQARASIHEVVRKTCAAANVAPAAIEAACLGISGAGRPETAQIVEAIAGEILPCRAQIAGDMVIALYAAFGNGPGVVTIAGTGSIAYGRDANGATMRAGGWGFAISDEGSGQWIGRTAVHRALTSYDGGEDARLMNLILGAWEITAQEQLVRMANATPPPDFSQLFPAVLALADGGDATARSILSDAGLELAALAKLVMARIGKESGLIVPVAMVGGVFRQSALVRQAFYNEIRAKYPEAAVSSTVIEPVLGALAMARTRSSTASEAGGASSTG